MSKTAIISLVVVMVLAGVITYFIYQKKKKDELALKAETASGKIVPLTISLPPDLY